MSSSCVEDTPTITQSRPRVHSHTHMYTDTPACAQTHPHVHRHTRMYTDTPACTQTHPHVHRHTHMYIDSPISTLRSYMHIKYSLMLNFILFFVVDQIFIVSSIIHSRFIHYRLPVHFVTKQKNNLRSSHHL